MFKDYADFTGIEFICGDKKRGEDAYFEDVSTRGTRGGSGRNKKNIDLIIVADQLLTGYDSKFLNTLYVDRTLELQSLIQAYSRTNRVYGKNKEFGTIINFKYPKITEESVNTALKLYGSGGTSSKAIVEHYETAVEKFVLKVQGMIETLASPTDWEELKTNDERKKLFILSFRDTNDQLRLVMQYYEFKWDDDSFGIDEHIWLKYVGAYRNLTFKVGEPPEDEPVIPLVGKTKLSGTQVIDANHILSLIGSKIKTDKGIQTADSETLRIIYEEIQELSDMGEDEQAKLLKEFVETELVPGNLSSDLSFDESFDNWKQKKVEKEVKKFAQDWGIDESLLSKSVDHFSMVREDDIPYIAELSESVDFKKATKQESRNQLEHTMTLINKALPNWLVKIKQKYN
jgi:type I restriction enzyme R subunit